MIITILQHFMDRMKYSWLRILWYATMLLVVLAIFQYLVASVVNHERAGLFVVVGLLPFVVASIAVSVTVMLQLIMRLAAREELQDSVASLQGLQAIQSTFRGIARLGKREAFQIECAQRSDYIKSQGISLQLERVKSETIMHFPSELLTWRRARATSLSVYLAELLTLTVGAGSDVLVLVVPELSEQDLQRASMFISTVKEYLEAVAKIPVEGIKTAAQLYLEIQKSLIPDFIKLGFVETNGNPGNDKVRLRAA